MVDEDIKRFADASYWLDHFPPLAMEDLKSIGIHVSIIEMIVFFIIADVTRKRVSRFFYLVDVCLLGNW